MGFVTLKVFDTAIGAYILKNKLEGEEITCYIFDENIVTLNPLFNFAVGGIRLQVAEEDYDKAKAILDEMDSKPYLDSKEEVITCPTCKSDQLYSDFKTVNDPKGVIAIITAFLFSVFPLYSKSVYKCKTCGTEFEPSAVK